MLLPPLTALLLDKSMRLHAEFAINKVSIRPRRRMPKRKMTICSESPAKVPFERLLEESPSAGY